ncbi:MAG: ABC transporter substrate-binding protein [Oscillospiraceae bacterium]|nr:ABC transporter substrate-binding protein [Oscillospiraceae bacterium]
MKKKHLSFLCLLMALVLTLTACGSDGGSGGSTEASTKDTFVYALAAEPGTLDGLLANDFNCYILTHNIYDTLIFEEPDGTLVPCLAESWTYNDAGDEITFNLRKGVKFHDGSDFTSADVVFTYEKDMANSATANLTSVMKSIEAIDEYTVKLTLKNAYGPIESCCSGSQLVIVSKSAYEADPEGYARNPIGTGPYRFVSWDAGDKITLTRFDEYWGDAPAIKDVTFKIISDTSTAVVALETGEIDMVQPSVADRDSIMANPDLAWYEVEQLSTYFLCMNNSKGLFTDENLRMAMAYGIDREALLEGALNGIGVVCNTPMAKVTGWPSDFEWYEYDPEKAKEYLTAAGYPDGLTITFTTMAQPGYIKPTEILQDQLSKIGVTVKIDQIERAAFVEKVVSNKDFEVCVMSATAFIPDSDYLYAQYHSTGGRNYTQCAVPELDAALEAARLEQDSDKRNEYYREVCQIFKDNAIQVPLYIGMVSQAANAKLKGYEISPMRRIYVKDYYWEA